MRISIPPAKRKSQRPRIRPAKAAPVAALTLVAAVYDSDTNDNVTLTFDRPIDIAALDPAAIEVSDGVYVGSLLRGVSAGTVLLAPDRLKVMLADIGSVPAGDITLTATAANGIVAVDDGGAWAGVSAVVLPYP
jgi:hypothetical protein